MGFILLHILEMSSVYLYKISYFYANNPVILHPFYSNVVADPSVITPDYSHDGKWHLFCHTMFGVCRYESDDGVSFKNMGRIVSRAMRPDINIIDGRYYLFYERTREPVLNALSLVGVKWKSEIYCTESKDLVSWKYEGLVFEPEKEDERVFRRTRYKIEQKDGCL